MWSQPLWAVAACAVYLLTFVTQQASSSLHTRDINCRPGRQWAQNSTHKCYVDRWKSNQCTCRSTRGHERVGERLACNVWQKHSRYKALEQHNLNHVYHPTYASRVQPHRLLRVLRDLQANKTQHVYVLGGSITAPNFAHTWVGIMRRWFEKRLPAAKVYNSAAPGTTSSYANLCFNELVGDDADLVVIEYTANNYVSGHVASFTQDAAASDLQLQFEQLLRKVLSLPNSPAVIVLHHWSPEYVKMKHFWDTAQTSMDVIATYYGVMSTSLREELFFLNQVNATLYTADDFLKDGVHPNSLGQQYLANSVLCVLEWAHGQLKSGIKVGRVGALPAPMFPGNYQSESFCVSGDKLRARAATYKGWKWRRGEKSGFETTEQGLPLRLLLPNVSAPSVMIALGHVRGYTGMAAAQASCQGGCVCKRQVFECTHSVPNTQLFFHSMNVTIRDHVKPCYVVVLNVGAKEQQVEVGMPPRTAEGVVKVMSIIVTSTGLNDRAVAATKHLGQQRVRVAKDVEIM